MKPQPATIHTLSPHTQAVIGRHGTIILQGNHHHWHLNPRELDRLTQAWHTHRTTPTRNPAQED